MRFGKAPLVGWLAITIGISGCPEPDPAGSIDPLDVTQSDLEGFWISEPAGDLWFTLEFWPNPDGSGMGTFDQRQPTAGHYPGTPFEPGLYDALDGALITEREEVVVDPESPANWWLEDVRRETRIASFSDAGMVLEMDSDAIFPESPSPELTLTHVGPTDPCPVGTDGGWQYAGLPEIGSLGSWASNTFGDLVVDSQGRPFAFFGQSSDEGSATNLVTPAGCLWSLRAFTAAAFGGEVVMDSDDRIHAFLATSTAALYITQTADDPLLSPLETLEVGPPLTGQGTITPMSMTLDGAGVPWVLRKTWDWTDDAPLLFRIVDGELLPLALGPLLQGDTARSVIELATDEAGEVHAFLGPFPDGNDVIYEFDHITFEGDVAVQTVRVPIPQLERPTGEVLVCAMAGLQASSDGSLEARCTFEATLGGPLDFAYATWDGTQWDLSLLGIGAMGPLRIGRDGSRLMTDGQRIFRKRSGDWQIASSNFVADARLTGVDTSASGVLHAMYAGLSGYAVQLEEPSGEAVISVEFDGPGSGRVTTLDGATECTSTCQITATRGDLVRLVAEADPGSVLTVNDSRYATSDGVLAVPASEDLQEVYVQFWTE